MSQLTYNDTLTILDCGVCHISFAMPENKYRKAKQDGHWFWCPNGDKIHYSETEHQRLRKQVDRLEARNVHLEDQGLAAALEAEKLRGQILRDRHRVANGVCPCCNRTFQQVVRHMRTQHPDYDLTKVEGLPNTVRFGCECGQSFDTIRGLHIHQGHRRADDWWTLSSRFRRHLTKVG